jgi:hypothetical protein
MKKIAVIITCVVTLSAVCFGIPLHCFSEEEKESDVAKLMKEAKAYIQEGNKEKAVLTLDTAFVSADSAGDYNALMEIGDLYIAIDKSLNEKAMKAWQAAGRCKTHR